MDKQCLPRGEWGCFMCVTGHFVTWNFETVNWGVLAFSHTANGANFSGGWG
jgi:hypothetical protein